MLMETPFPVQRFVFLVTVEGSSVIVLSNRTSLPSSIDSLGTSLLIWRWHIFVTDCLVVCVVYTNHNKRLECLSTCIFSSWISVTGWITEEVPHPHTSKDVSLLESFLNSESCSCWTLSEDWFFVRWQINTLHWLTLWDTGHRIHLVFKFMASCDISSTPQKGHHQTLQHHNQT